MVAKKGRQAITDSKVGDGEKCCESLASVLGAMTLVGDAEYSIQLQDEVLGDTDEDEELGRGNENVGVVTVAVRHAVRPLLLENLVCSTA